MQPLKDHKDGLGQLQPVLRLLGRRLQRRRLAGPDRHRLPRRAVLLDGEPQGRRTATGRSTRSGTRACNETPLYIDLFGTGKRVLVMGFQPKGKDDRGPDGLLHARTRRTRTRLWEMHPISEPSAAGQGGPRHAQVQPRPGRRRPQRRRPARRDLHRRLVGAAGEGRRQDAVEVPPAPTSATRAPTCSPTTWTATARPTCSAPRPTSSASGGTSSGPTRRTKQPAFGPRSTCSRAGVRDARRALRGHRRRRAEGPRHRQAVVVPRPQRAGVRLARRALLVQGARRTRTGSPASPRC